MNAQAAMQAIKFDHPRHIEPEDQVRADFYALLATLFYRAPDEALLRAMMLSAEPEGEAADDLAKAWAALAAASAVVSHDAVAEEYEAVFVGVDALR